MSDLRDDLNDALIPNPHVTTAGVRAIVDELMPVINEHVEAALAEQREAIAEHIRSCMPSGPIFHDGYRRGLQSAEMLVREYGKEQR